MSSTLAPSAPVPSVIRTRAMIASAKVTPTKENPPSSDRTGALLGTWSAPVRSDEGGFSFVGVTFADAIIARVRITLGTGALGANVEDISAGGTVDVVVVDNLIYSEPRRIL